MPSSSSRIGGSQYVQRSRREYRRAVRHSRFVRMLKFTCPLLSVMVLAGFFWASIFNAALPDGFSVDRTTLENGKLVMNDPVLTGENKDGAMYKLTARRAIQDLKDTSHVRLEAIKASLPLGNGKFADINAKSAIYDRKNNVIVFDNPFQVSTDSGTSATLKSARFDVGAGQLTSDDDVQITTVNGDIVARSLRMRDNGKTMEFNDHVKMTVNPSAVEAGPEKAPTKTEETK
ncbi:LPS export ABC transporter periplasmic protein LptC [Pararhizobium mangrovi]|uniref:LPS export ABC transporter periplasmic protein LptC n=1 Tax=Pararhizobium mangrovi TaxID=2590452 RepID=A0A506U592_9HYPH|nr:LPS export ABC transporter periplasmic protein LptC [Pararhizobium mangrovi]TPW28351.1 hypothetical protein FJU11_09340 [Pararhizobium mangrovi]